MACQDCFNGCVGTKTTDQCVVYTGDNIPELGIEKGFPLLYVEQALFKYLKSALNGTGIIPQLEDDIICELISKHLPTCSECDGITLNHILIALIKALCELNIIVQNVQNEVDIINSDYNLQCISVAEEPYGVHDVIQGIIDKVCALNLQLISLATNLSTNYVSIANINSYIANYLASIGSSSLVKNKMIPYTAMEYYGPLGYFDASGAGIGDWVDVYLCNGNNGTPDKRGRVAVGATTGMGGGVMSGSVNPAVAGNPDYTLLSVAGSNLVTLTTAQIPSHNHIATFTGSPHNHPLTAPYYSKAGSGTINTLDSTNDSSHLSVNSTGFATAGGSVTVASTGGGESHPNIQPSIGCYYIIYLP
jgi:microcystin-dependent protein